MEEKLSFRHHKAILSVVLFVLLIIGVVFGMHLSVASTAMPMLQIAIFGFTFLQFVLLLIITSMLIRTRDEIHIMHGENHDHFREVHEIVDGMHQLVKEVHSTVQKRPSKKKTQAKRPARRRR